MNGMKQTTKPKGKKDVWSTNLIDQILDSKRIAEIYNRRFKK